MIGAQCCSQRASDDGHDQQTHYVEHLEDRVAEVPLPVPSGASVNDPVGASANDEEHRQAKHVAQQVFGREHEASATREPEKGHNPRQDEERIALTVDPTARVMSDNTADAGDAGKVEQGPPPLPAASEDRINGISCVRVLLRPPLLSMRSPLGTSREQGDTGQDHSVEDRKEDPRAKGLLVVVPALEARLVANAVEPITVRPIADGSLRMAYVRRCDLEAAADNQCLQQGEGPIAIAAVPRRRGLAPSAASAEEEEQLERPRRDGGRPPLPH
mmetsp:Transcript_120645/g.257678  ORF Transcript_120645/g.257678 Transcript_120645/m.257678 type:complete len:273 (+) Transcript_120645:970-1788(+)